jgi:fructose-bisphosphate aldolase class I
LRRHSANSGDARAWRDAGVLVEIKVDPGAKALATRSGETVTEGLYGLRERLHDCVEMGARFAKWRRVIAIDRMRLPTTACTSANAHAPFGIRPWTSGPARKNAAFQRSGR